MCAGVSGSHVITPVVPGALAEWRVIATCASPSGEAMHYKCQAMWATWGPVINLCRTCHLFLLETVVDTLRVWDASLHLITPDEMIT